ncbi:OmpA family protein [Ideonella paludis]
MSGDKGGIQIKVNIDPKAASAEAKVFFASGAATLPAGAQDALSKVAEAAKINPAKLSISGFHDASGDPVKNAELAKERALAVRDALKAAGIAEDRFEMKKPEQINAGNDAEARRVEVRLL